MGKETLFQYLKYFEDAQFVTLLENRDGGVTSQKKAYMVDNGLFAPLRSLSPESGKLYENQIFRDLGRKGVSFQFLKQPGGDTDFVSGDTAIQACYSLTDDNFERECSRAAAALRYPGINHAQIVILYDHRALKKDMDIPKKCRIVSYFLFTAWLRGVT